MCKPWKINGAKGSGLVGDAAPFKASELRRLQVVPADELCEHGGDPATCRVCDEWAKLDLL